MENKMKFKTQSELKKYISNLTQTHGNYKLVDGGTFITIKFDDKYQLILKVKGNKKN